MDKLKLAVIGGSGLYELEALEDRQWARPNAEGETLEVRWLNKQKLIATASISVVSIALLTIYIDPFFFALANIANVWVCLSAIACNKFSN